MGDRRLKLLPYLALAILAAVLVLPFPDALDSEAWRPLFDIAHLPLFAVLSLWLITRLSAARVPHAVLVTLLAMAGMAGLVEMVQPLVGRSGNLSDALAGIAGALIATTGWRIWIKGRSPLLRSGHAFLSLGLALVVLWPPLLQIGAWWWQLRSFPMLGDFETALEQRIWTAYPGRAAANRNCPGGATHGRRSLALQTWPGVYSGVRYQANDGDWTGYDRMIFDLYLPAGGPHLALRIDDDGDTTELESRFNRALELSPGWNRISIPLEEVANGPVHRRLDLAAIRQLLIFAGPRETEQGLFCLDHVRLE
jgi:VanZ family protein